MLKQMKRRVGPVSLSLAAAALTAIAFAAVSFAAKDDGSKQGNGEAHQEFRSCMQDQGVDLPEPPPAPGEDSQEGEDGERRFEHRLKPPSESERAEMEEALEACSEKLPEGARQMGPPCGPPPGGPEGRLPGRSGEGSGQGPEQGTS